MIALVVVSSGCSSLAPPQRDHFYRLNIVAPALADPAATDGSPMSLHVAPFAASGMHSERALVLADADGTSLEQCNYHLWIESPRRMLQTTLADYLHVALGTTVLMEPLTGVQLSLRGRIVRFEHESASAGGQAVVALHFELFRAGTDLPLFSRSYEKSLVADGNSMTDVVAAINAATADIFTHVARDVSAMY